MRNFFKKFFKKFDSERQRIEIEEYAKEILAFSSPTKNQDRMGQEIAGLTEYDFVDDSGSNKIRGHHEKRFVRLHKGYFSDLFESIKTTYPNCSYITYLNEKDIAVDGLIPTNVSVLLKRLNAKTVYLQDPKQIYNEKLVSRILNFFDAKTVYNEIIINGDKEYVLSVDFIKPNQRYYPLNIFDGLYEMHSLSGIKLNLESIEDKIKQLCSQIKEQFGKTPKVDMGKIKEEYAYIFLIRAILLGDADLCERNVGFIYDILANTISFAPALDFEYCFINDKNNFCETSLKYIEEKYPKVYKKFMDKVEMFSKRSGIKLKKNYESFINKHINNQQANDEYVAFLKKSIAQIKEYHLEKTQKQK